MPTDCKYVCCCTAWILLYSEDIFHENSHVRLNSPLSCGAVAFRFLWFAAHHVFSFFLFFEFNCKYVMFWGGSVCALLFFYIRIPKCIHCCRNASVKMPFFLFFFYSLIRIVVLVLLPLFDVVNISHVKSGRPWIYFMTVFFAEFSVPTIKVQFPDHSWSRVAYLLCQ